MKDWDLRVHSSITIFLLDFSTLHLFIQLIRASFMGLMLLLGHFSRVSLLDSPKE